MLTSTGQRILGDMRKRYGPKKGDQVFYASLNKGTIKRSKVEKAKHYRHGSK